MNITRIYGGCKISNGNGTLEVTAQEMLDIAAYVTKNQRELEAIIISHSENCSEEEWEKACAYLADLGEQDSLQRAEETAERYFITGSASHFIPIN